MSRRGASLGVWKKAFGHCQRAGCANFISRSGFYHIISVSSGRVEYGPYCSEKCFKLVRLQIEEEMAERMMQPHSWPRRRQRRKASS